MEELKCDAFSCYEGFAQWLEERQYHTERVGLDEYTGWIYEYGQACGLEQEGIRDSLVIDRMVSNRTGRLPEFLQRKDAEFARAKKRYRGQGGVALLYQGGHRRVLIADYTQGRDIDGRYPYKILDWKNE